MNFKKLHNRDFDFFTSIMSYKLTYISFTDDEKDSIYFYCSSFKVFQVPQLIWLNLNKARDKQNYW